MRRLERSVSDALEVQDHRDGVLELVRHVLGVVEALGHDEVDAHLVAPVAAPSDRPQDGGAGVVVGEDVVDLVAPAPARQAPDVGPVAIAVLELGLGLGSRLRSTSRSDQLVVLELAFLGKPEVHERTVPGVPEGH